MIYLLLLSLILVSTRHAVGLSADGCGGDFKNTSGDFKLDSKSNDSVCTWYITTQKAGQVTLNFKGLKLGSSNLTIFAGNESASPQIVQKTKFEGRVTVISHAVVTKIVFTRGNGDKTASLDVHYNTENCSVEFSGQRGMVNSPVYRDNSGKVSCTYEISLTDNVDVPVISFPMWTLSSANLSVKFDAGKPKTLSSTDDVLGTAGVKMVTMLLQIDNGTVQQFTAVYQTADKACSGTFTTGASRSFGMLKLPEKNSLPVLCYAQILSSDAKKQIYISNTGTKPGLTGFDSVVFLDGAQQSASVIGSLISGGAPWFVSSSGIMTVIANLGATTTRDTSLSYKEDAFSKLYSLSDSTNISISLDGAKVKGEVVWLQIQSVTVAKVAFKAATSLTNVIAAVTVQDNAANKLFSFSKDTVLFPVNSPVGGARIVVQGLNGTDKVELTVSRSDYSDCNKLYQGMSELVSIHLGENATAGCTTVISTGAENLFTEFMTYTATLCPNTTIEVYEGTEKTAPKLGTLSAKRADSKLPQIEFPAGSKPRLVWNKVDTSCKKQSLTGSYRAANSVCKPLGSEITGNIKTPYFPNQYPLNVLCTWPIPAKNHTMLYLSANTIQFGARHSLVLKGDGNTTLKTFSGNTLPNDQIFPNNKLSLVFSSKTNDSSQLDQSGQGANVIYKILTCGGMVTNASQQISNPVTQSAVECIWIIKVPANGTEDSVNIVSANLSVTGYNQSTNTKLEIRDGGSMRSPLLPVDLKVAKIPTLLSRFNFLWIRYVVDGASNAAKPFNFTVKYSVYNCNKSSLCDNGICLHPTWRCDGHDHCGDGTDERNCNGTKPLPPPTTTVPAPHGGGGSKGGVAAYWVVICLLIGIVLGIALVYVIPRIMRRARLRNYHAFSNTENA